MRVIAGEFGGRRLVAPKGDVARPTQDRVREAWFSILGPAVQGARVLDLYAGSGALGLEALSRGATHADFVEKARASLAALDRNIAALGVAAQCTVHRGDALAFAAALAPGSYDVAFADPPYDLGAGPRLVALFRERPFARILCVEHRATEPLSGDETRRYGDSAITFCFAE
ncbi:MAG TPA: 16S rRNA (guanine(966)-N(2))-methyltransferase RsmD [Gemmatimonadales bacterium]|nr:16S rRNA (guanine(966)-N(2))-methyltransferase RsmD [Gemmatimonadales bacterium]